MIADFGLSRIMEEEKLSMLTEICGTPGVGTSHSFTTSSLTRYCTVHGPRNLQKK